MKEYTIIKNNNVPLNIVVDEFPWGKPSVYPRTYAGVTQCRNGFRVRMKAYEANIRAMNTISNSPVCQDSCMEFFFSPCPEISKAYFNFEVNPKGTMYVGYSDKGTRESSKPVQDLPDKIYFGMKAICQYNVYWEISYTIPYEFIRNIAGKFDINNTKYILANLYKCGDRTEFPHYAVWNKIETDTPDYHQPDFFGKMYLEQ